MKAFIFLICLTLSGPSLAEQNMFNVLSQDIQLVTDIRTEGDNVWIKLNPENLSDEITVRISNKNQDFYRPWFNGSVDLVSKGFRGNNVWSDRVQTAAKYIEYWHKGELALHLERK